MNIVPIALYAVCAGGYATGLAGLTNSKTSKQSIGCLALMGGSVLGAGCIFFYSSYQVKPIELPKVLPPPSFQKVTLNMPSEPVMLTSENLGSVWETGDFLVGDILGQKEDMVAISVMKPRIFTLTEKGQVLVDSAAYYEGWALEFVGEDLVKLREQFGKWMRTDILRPIKIEGDLMTFSHLPSQEIFSASTKNLKIGRFFDFVTQEA